jgi:hypothetical protein
MFNITVTKNNDFIINSQFATVDTALIVSFNNEGNQLWQIQKHGVSRSMLTYGNNLMTTAQNTANQIIILDYSGKIIKIISLSTEVVASYFVLYVCPDTNSGNFYLIARDAASANWMAFLYDNNLNFIRSFTVADNHPSQIVNGCLVENGYLYIARSKYGEIHHSNVSADIYKYDSLGNLIWSKELPDRYGPYLTSAPDGNIYCGTTNLWSYDTTQVTWEAIKLDTDGNTLWSKYWVGPFNFSTVQFVYGITATPTGGCLIYGNSSKLNVSSDGWYDPLAICYSSNGDSVFSIRNAESTNYGGITSYFATAAWDKNNALLLAGYVDGVAKVWKYSIDGITAVKKENSGLPSSFSLSQNYPNPFNPSTTINFSIPHSGQVTLKVYDLLGREVTTLVNEELKFGNYSTKFEASSLASGIYVYRLTAKNFTATKKMVLVK